MSNEKNLTDEERDILLGGTAHGVYMRLELVLKALCGSDSSDKLDHLADEFEGIFHNPDVSIDEKVLNFSLFLDEIMEN